MVTAGEIEAGAGGVGADEVFHRAPSAMLILDLAGDIIFTNLQAAALFGYAVGALHHEPIGRLIVDDNARRSLASYLISIQGETVSHGLLRHGLACQVRRRDGTVFPAALSLARIHTHHGFRALVTAQDLSEWVHPLEEAREAQRRAEQESHMKDLFLSLLSHELRTPLTPILTWATMLRTRRLDPTAVASGLAAIERAARTQLRLIEDLLDMARILTGKLGLTMTPAVKFRKVSEDALESVRPTAEQRKIRLRAELADITVRGDPERLQQVVWNLLSNAIKFSADGMAVHIRLRAVAGSAELTVTDDGQGIESDFLPHVFERFQQQDGSQTRSHGGLGLGLAIVRHLVEAHGGTVRAASPGSGHGATFTVVLPLAPSAAMPARTIESTAEPSLVGRQILLVEDEPVTAQAIGTYLGIAGANVLLAGSVPEAMSLIGRCPVDLLLADIGLPGEDGYSLIRQIRRIENHKRTRMPALALTAYARPEDREEALAAGFDVHLAKPVDPRVLVQEISKLTVE